MSFSKFILGASGVYASYLVNSILLEKMYDRIYLDSHINTHSKEKLNQAKITFNTQTLCNYYRASSASFMHRHH